MFVTNLVWCRPEEIKGRFLPGNLVVIPKRTHNKQDINPFVLYEERGGLVGLPRGYFFDYLVRADDRIEDRTIKGVEKFLPVRSEFKWRDEQLALINEATEKIKQRYGGIVVASGGFGKTVCALGIINQLKLYPVLIVVHRRVLIFQWQREIHKVFGKIDCGVIVGNVCNYRSKDFVIGMLQSLAMKDYGEDLYRNFAVVVFDECHRISTPIFHKAIKKFLPRYFIGLTATVERADKTEKVYLYYLGKIVASYKKQMLSPAFRIIRLSCPFKSRDISTLITKLVDNPSRNNIIREEIVKAVEAGRWVIVLSDRIKHLELLKNITSVDSAVIIGGSTREEVEEAKKKKVIFSTYQFLSEGFDDAKRDTLFLVTPRVHVKQAVGRILRPFDGKKKPLVVDFVDDHYILTRLFLKRRRIYESLKNEN